MKNTETGSLSTKANLNGTTYTTSYCIDTLALHCTLYNIIRSTLNWHFKYRVSCECATHECNIGPRRPPESNIKTSFALVPVLLSGGRQRPILHLRVKYSGPYEKSNSITSNYLYGI